MKLHIHSSMIFLSLCTPLFCQSNEMSFRHQKGTYSKISLCKNGLPYYERQTRSILECLSVCWNVLGNDCKSFKYQSLGKICSIYADVIKNDYIEVVNGSCIGYQAIPDCLSGFRHLIEMNRCVRMEVGSWNWTLARDRCNHLHPLSHLVVLDSATDAKLYSLYGTAEVLPRCVSPGNAKYHAYWSAGIRPYVGGVRQPFQWQKYPGSGQLLKPTTPWNPGQPNSPADGNLYCIAGYIEWLLDDSFCSIALCAMCEFDLP